MIGVFGSAFNPPTRGHLDAIQQALAACDEVWLVPAIAHAFGKQMLQFEQRVNLVRAFLEDIADPRLKLCTVENELWDGCSPVYTIQVLRALQSRYPSLAFTFVCGPDNAEKFETFVGAAEIRNYWGLLAIESRCNVRSTLVRDGLRERQPISAWVTPRVEALIQDQTLYV